MFYVFLKSINLGFQKDHWIIFMHFIYLAKSFSGPFCQVMRKQTYAHSPTSWSMEWHTASNRFMNPVCKHSCPCGLISELHTICFCPFSIKNMCFSYMVRRVFPKLDIYVPDEMVKKIVTSTPGAIMPVLSVLKEKLEEKQLQTTNSTPVCTCSYKLSHVLFKPLI